MYIQEEKILTQTQLKAYLLLSFYTDTSQSPFPCRENSFLNCCFSINNFQKNKVGTRGFSYLKGEAKSLMLSKVSNAIFAGKKSYFSFMTIVRNNTKVNSQPTGDFLR